MPKPKKHHNMTDRELLIQAATDIVWLKELMTGHLQHHARLYFAGLGIMSTLIITLVVFIVTAQ